MTMTGPAPRIHIEGSDLLAQDLIRATVREVYGSVQPGGRAVAERFYDAAELARLPDGAVEMALGVGNPVRHAALRPGESVVDLGSGGGIDCLLAGHAVAPEGSVIGVDFAPEMIERATANAALAVLPNVTFVQGEIEALPLPDTSVDVVISNGVPNLSPRKARVFAEAYRVLRPGGRLVVVDLMLDHDLPTEIRTSPVAWAGCLSGALSEIDFYKGVRRAGFRDVSITPIEPFGLAEVALYPLFTDDVLDLLRRLVPAERQDRIATSELVRARKPATAEILPGRARP
jgi:SAM-dependent methyltransferase